MPKRELIARVSSGHEMIELHALIHSSRLSERRMVITAFKEYVQGLRDEQCPETWQKAWNAFRAGRQVVRITPRCTDCNGRGYVSRGTGRGNNVCRGCHGTLLGRPVSVPVAAAFERPG